MRLLKIGILGFLFSLPVMGVEPLPSVHYFDEVSNRFVTLNFKDTKRVDVVFRFVGGPGSSSRWYGDGEKKDKEIFFAQTVGEEQDRGTYFIAKGGESKLEIGFKSGQREPQDAGINGVYRHITEDKRTSLAKKEAAAADDALNSLFKTATKIWITEDKPVLTEWKNRWPALRDRWMKLVYVLPTSLSNSAAKASAGSVGKSAEANVPEKQADYLIAESETTGLAINFMNQAMDKLIPLGWDGDYDDGFGGHVSLKKQQNGKLRISLNFSRANDNQTGEIAGEILPENIVEGKDKPMSAMFFYTDPEIADKSEQAKISIKRVGHFLFVETEKAERYASRGWFDGIYRWMPPPQN